MPERLGPISVPRLHRVGHVQIQAEIRREHAVVRVERLQVLRRARPGPLELVIVYEEMAPLARLVGGGRGERVVVGVES